jgi:hypothetical protein
MKPYKDKDSICKKGLNMLCTEVYNTDSSDGLTAAAVRDLERGGDFYINKNDLPYTIILSALT